MALIDLNQIFGDSKKLRALRPQLFVFLGLLHRELNFGGQITLCYRAIK